MGRNKRALDPPVRSLPGKVSKRGHSSVSLRLESGSGAFVCATEELPVPPHLAQRSELITDLLHAADEYQKDVPVQISFPEARAWLELAAGSSNTGTKESAELKDEKVLQALKVADFLRDPVTIEELMWRVLAMIHRSPKTSGPLTRARKSQPAKPSTVPTTKERQRAMKIVERVPAGLMPRVLAAAKHARFQNHTSSSVGSTGDVLSAEIPGRRAECPPMARLVQLLPRTFHPAIAAAFTDEEDAAAITIKDMPHCLMAPTIYADRGNGNRRYASVTFQILAALATLAAGCLDRAWCADGTERVERAAAALRAGDADGEALRELTLATAPSDPGAIGAAGTAGTAALLDVRASTITKVILSIPGEGARKPREQRGADVTPEPPRWCFALAQLRALRTFAVTAADPRHLHPAELGAVLLQLTALESLSVTCKDAWDVRPGDARDPPGNHPSPDLPLLHAAISRMTQLVKLALRNCYYAGRPDDGASGERGVLVVAPEFAALTRLTSLTLDGNFPGVSSHPAMLLADRVRRVTTLCELSLQWCGDRLHSLWSIASLLLASTELTGLQSLGLRGSVASQREQRPDPVTLHLHLHLVAVTRISALTALDLSFGLLTRSISTAGFPFLLADMPNLRVLNVACMELADTGMHVLARGLGSIPRLTHLDVHGNRGDSEAVLAVVKALVDAGVGAPEGLQDLDLSGNTIFETEVEAAANFAALLRQLAGLRAVGLPDGMGVEGLGEVVGALGDLPQLRRVHVCAHGDVSNAQRATLFAPLGEAKCRFAENGV